MKAISPTSTAIIIHSHHHSVNHHRWFLSLPPRPQRHQHLTRSTPKPHSLKLTFITKAADSTSQPSSSVAKTIVADDGFSFSKVINESAFVKNKFGCFFFMFWKNLDS